MMDTALEVPIFFGLCRVDTYREHFRRDMVAKENALANKEVKR